jgi:hypothetical protein
MGYYTDITAGLGAFIAAGFLTLEGSVIPSIIPATSTTILTPLSYVLYAAGFLFIGAGMYERFFSSRLKPHVDNEVAAETKSLSVPV